MPPTVYDTFMDFSMESIIETIEYDTESQTIKIGYKGPQYKSPRFYKRLKGNHFVRRDETSICLQDIIAQYQM